MAILDADNQQHQPAISASWGCVIPRAHLCTDWTGACSPVERWLLSLPVCLSGLNILKPVTIQRTQCIKDDQRTSKWNHHQPNTELHKAWSPTHQLTNTTVTLGRYWIINMPNCTPTTEAGFQPQQKRISSLHYHWQLKILPRHRVSHAPFSTDHAMTCKHGSLTITRQNKIHDITVN